MGALLLTAATVSAQYNTTLNFTVDMSAQIAASTFNPPPPQGTGTDGVWVNGSFNNWSGGVQLVARNLSATDYVWTNQILDAADVEIGNEGSVSWKLSDSASWENTADWNNRQMYLPTANGQTLNMPYTYFGDAGPASPEPTSVTFCVDMAAQSGLGNFIIGTDTLEVKGSWDGWAGDPLTQVSPPDGSVYSTTITLPFTRAICSSIDAMNDFKYVATSGVLAGINGGYEDPAPINQDGGGNRWFIIQPTDSSVLSLPCVEWSDTGYYPEQYLASSDCMVTWNVNVADAVGTDGYVFGTDPNDVICINGVSGGTSPSWATWNPAGPPFEPLPPPLPGLAMTPTANPDIWTITLPINTGNYEYLVYKYSINGWDDENGFGDNHNRWIRDTNMVFLGGSWVMPTDTFGQPSGASFYELNFGNLAIALSGSQVNVTWYGHNGISLQTATSVNGPWTTQPSTDGSVLDCAQTTGTATINYGANQPATYYRLIEHQP